MVSASTNPVELYRKFSQEFFYKFHKHSSDVEIEEMAKRYSTWLNKNSRVVNDILLGAKQAKDLRKEARRELEDLASAEAKYDNDLPLNIQGEYFEDETGFSDLKGELRRLVEGRSHLVRLVKPSEYDKNYWFYTEGESYPQNVFCREFGLDMIECLRGIQIAHRSRLLNLRQAIAFQKEDVYQFWALAPYLHHCLMELGYAWDMSIMTLLKIASKRFARDGQPFAGSTRFQLGYDERMPTHLIARMEAMRDIRCLKKGEYSKKFGIELPDGV
jgi:hypothetical protein